MPRKGHSEEKIVYALRQVEAGKKVADLCREMGVLAAGVLQLETALRGAGVERTPGIAAVARREPQAKDVGRGSYLGQAHLAGSSLKKKLEARGPAGTGALYPRIAHERRSPPRLSRHAGRGSRNGALAWHS